MEQRRLHQEESEGRVRPLSAPAEDLETAGAETAAPVRMSEEIDLLENRVAARQGRKRRVPNIALLLCNLYLIYGLANTLYFLFVRKNLLPHGFVIPWWQYALMFGVPALLLLTLNRLHLQLKQASAALDPSQAAFRPEAPANRRIGTLAEALDSPHPQIRRDAARRLVPLLSHLKPDEAALLDDYQRDCLYRRLSPLHAFQDPDLAVAILKALECSDDAAALPWVERLAEGRAWTDRMRSVQGAARQWLQSLEARLATPHAGFAVATVSPSAASEAEAEEALTPEKSRAVLEVESLLQQLEEEKRKHSQPGMRIGFLLASWLTIVPYTATRLYDSWTEGNGPMAALWGLLLACATQLHRFSLSPKQSKAARMLAQYDDVRGVGLLAEALEWPDTATRRVAADALTRLLPRLQASDTGLLNAKQRACLYRLLTPGHARAHLDLQLAILKALEQVGDDAAVRPVERLAQLVFPVTGRQKQLKAAANECLLYLRDRADLTRASQTLLRASCEIAASPDTLLRAASGGPEISQEHLLRASAPQTD